MNDSPPPTLRGPAHRGSGPARGGPACLAPPRLRDRAWAAALALLATAACRVPGETAGTGEPSAEPPASTASAGAEPGPEPDEVERRIERARCTERIAGLLALPALPGTPGLDRVRPEILTRAKATPVLFRRPPATQESPREAALLRVELDRAAAPAWQLARHATVLRNRPELARSIFLREGYLYAERPAVAAAVTEWVELGHFTRSDEVLVQSGSLLRRARRGKLGYVWADGPEAGRRARLVLFDRVLFPGEERAPALHWDVRALQRRLGFDELTPVHLAEPGVVADLRYGDRVVRAALESRDLELELACEVVEETDRTAVEQARSRHRAVARAVERIRDVVDRFVEEGVPFDEPRTEEGQQDGNLRPGWLWAYRHGWFHYEFNGDSYAVFDASGRPLVPQVCIDFITDVLERASGTWYRPQQEERERTAGRLDLDALGIDNRRSVEALLRWAWSRPDWFEVVDLDAAERVPLLRGADFHRHLHEHRARYRPGDVVAIHGISGDGQLHWHSFFVLEADPVTGVPTLLGSNAGRPRVRTWEQEMRAAPRRSIRARIRPTLALFDLVSPPEEAVSMNEPSAGEPGSG